jgi:hypothetical protein
LLHGAARGLCRLQRHVSAGSKFPSLTQKLDRKHGGRIRQDLHERRPRSLCVWSLRHGQRSTIKPPTRQCACRPTLSEDGSAESRGGHQQAAPSARPEVIRPPTVAHDRLLLFGVLRFALVAKRASALVAERHSPTHRPSHGSVSAAATLPTPLTSGRGLRDCALDAGHGASMMRCARGSLKSPLVWR